MCCKLVGSDLTILDANKVLGKLPDMASWAFKMFTEHRNEVVGHTLSKVEDVRLSRWTSVDDGEQVVARAGTQGAPHDPSPMQEVG